MNNWSEQLPDKCPPDNAIVPDGSIFYRLCKSDPPTEIDFNSKRALHPTQLFKNVSECQARSLSVWNDLGECLNIVKLPCHRKKQPIVMQLALKSGDGLILQTFNPNHFSWWRTQSFDIALVAVIK